MKRELATDPMIEQTKKRNMKKKIFSIALVLAGMIGSTAIAQTPSTETTPAAKEQKCPACPAGIKQYNPFEGLNLTEKQQNELKALRESRKADLKKEMSKKKAEKKADRQAMREQAQNNRKEYLAKIKGILTPEQYVQFLENSFLNSRAGAPGPKDRKDMRGGKKMDRKKGMRGNRYDRQRPAVSIQAN